MPTRRSFLGAAAAIAAAGLTRSGEISPAEAAPAKGPSAASVAAAKQLQSQMPAALLGDALVEKIAGDIDGYASVAADFRKTTLHNWDEPDFVFAAAPNGGKA